MSIFFHDEYQPHYEAYVLLGNLMNKTTPEAFRDQLIKAGLAEEASLLLDDILSLYSAAAARVEPSDPKLQNLFNAWRQNETAMTSSDILAYPYLPDRLHSMREDMLALGEDQRKRQIFWGIATALGEDDLAGASGGSSLVQLLEQAGLNDNWKYHILWLYHCGAEATQVLQTALDNVAEVIAGSLADSSRHAKETIDQLRGISDFREYVLRETGVRLSEGDIHVYPSAILLGVALAQSEGSATERPQALIWGSRFLDARRLQNASQTQPMNTGEVLRALSEKTKFEILLALRERPFYGSELAEHLKLKPATVSHHMNELLKHGLVAAEPKQTRLYYSLNGARVREALQEALGLF